MEEEWNSAKIAVTILFMERKGMRTLRWDTGAQISAWRHPTHPDMSTIWIWSLWSHRCKASIGDLAINSPFGQLDLSDVVWYYSNGFDIQDKVWTKYHIWEEINFDLLILRSLSVIKHLEDLLLQLQWLCYGKLAPVTKFGLRNLRENPCIWKMLF